VRRVGPGVRVAPGAHVARDAELSAVDGGRIELGPTAVLGPRCRVHAAAAATVRIDGVLDEACCVDARDAVSVGAGARLGAGCLLVDWDPVFADPERPVRAQGARSAPVWVGAGAVLGPGVAVLRGVEIAAGARVLAHTVCRRNVPATPDAQHESQRTQPRA
jgi:acetyltransferase-like isoleucine patch superfamily enzyme